MKTTKFEILNNLFYFIKKSNGTSNLIHQGHISQKPDDFISIIWVIFDLIILIIIRIPFIILLFILKIPFRILAWFKEIGFSTNHKYIGILYLVFAVFAG